MRVRRGPGTLVGWQAACAAPAGPALKVPNLCRVDAPVDWVVGSIYSDTCFFPERSGERRLGAVGSDPGHQQRRRGGGQLRAPAQGAGAVQRVSRRGSRPAVGAPVPSRPRPAMRLASCVSMHSLLSVDDFRVVNSAPLRPDVPDNSAPLMSCFSGTSSAPAAHAAAASPPVCWPACMLGARANAAAPLPRPASLNLCAGAGRV